VGGISCQGERHGKVRTCSCGEQADLGEQSRQVLNRIAGEKKKERSASGKEGPALDSSRQRKRCAISRSHGDEHHRLGKVVAMTQNICF